MKLTNKFTRVFSVAVLVIFILFQISHLVTKNVIMTGDISKGGCTAKAKFPPPKWLHLLFYVMHEVTEFGMVGLFVFPLLRHYLGSSKNSTVNKLIPLMQQSVISAILCALPGIFTLMGPHLAPHNLVSYQLYLMLATISVNITSLNISFVNWRQRIFPWVYSFNLNKFCKLEEFSQIPPQSSTHQSSGMTGSTTQ